MYQKYGFYESIDYTPTRLKKNEEFCTVKTYMAHHQGLILISINNLFSNNIMQKRFMENPEIKAIDILLQEKMPENIIIKEEKEKVEKIKYVEDSSYSEREITKIHSKLPQINAISSNGYLIVLDEKGQGYSKFGDILINRYKKTSDLEQGIFFYFKNVKTNRIWTANNMSYLTEPDKYFMYFAPDQDKIVRQDGNIETVLKIGLAPNDPTEIRSLELTNNGFESETIEVTSFFEPVLSEEAQENSHPAFNNLFLNYEYIEDQGAILVNRRKRNKNETSIFLGACFFTENQTSRELEYEIDKEKFYGRNNMLLPKAVLNSSPFTKQIQYTTDPVICFKRTITIPPQEKVTLNFVLAVGTDKKQVLNSLLKYNNNETIKHQLELSKAKVQAENRYLGVTGKEVEFYQKILKLLIFPNPLKKLKYAGVVNLQVNKLWQYGISGDLPILLVKIKSENEIEVVEQMLKMYHYFNVKNIKMDLVILNDESYNYQSDLKDIILNCILNENIAYLQNVKGGIFVLDNLSKEESYFLECRANLCIDASYASTSRYLKELEEEYLEQIKEMPQEENVQILENAQPIREKLEDLKYFNEYGGFSGDGKEYLIRVNKEEKLPIVWSHILTNKEFGSLVTESMGGYTWHKNSRLNRLTSWNNMPVTDVPSEIIYLQENETKKVWSLGLSPCPDDNDYYITYGFGYAKYLHNSKGLTQKLDMFIPMNDNIKLQILRLENNELKKKKVKLVYYLKPVLGEDETKTNEYINLEFYENSNLVCAKNLVSDEEFKEYMFVSCSEKITSYTGSKEAFIGKGNLSNPEALHQISLNKENSLWNNAIIAIECEVELEALEAKEIIFTFGVAPKLLDLQDLAYKYSNKSKVYEEYEKTKKFWKEQTEKLQVTTPVESTNILLNGWLTYQVLASRMWGRTGYYQSGGAYGFRDQLQDSIALKYINPNIVKEQIIKHCRHQFIEGDVEHWWHSETSRGIRTRFSDDKLWLVYLVEDYINFTGDYRILKEEVPYRAGSVLEDGIDEKYDFYPISEIKESVYKHCKRAIDSSLNFGENNLPKIGSGDWNDGFNEVGNKRKRRKCMAWIFPLYSFAKMGFNLQKIK